MNRRPALLFSAAVVVAMLAVSAFAWIRLPEDARLPIHWGPDGTVDGDAPKGIALLMMPLLAVLLTGLFAVLPRFEPRRENLERSAKPYTSIWFGIVAFFGVVHAAIVAIALGVDVSVPRLILVGVGALFALIGNYLPKTRSSFFMGIRTPWTLSSERSWAVTHRLGGRGFVIIGAVTAACGLLDLAPVAAIVALLGGMAVLIPILVVVSYRTWKADPDRVATSVGMGGGR